MISSSIVNFNQGNKLLNCLKSISDFSDEIIVFDLGSKDNSKKISENFGAKFISEGFAQYVELLRNKSIDIAKGDWILILDPDEELTDELKEKLKNVIYENKYDCVDIPRKNIFFGKWIAHTNWWPDYHIRFFKKGKVNWVNKIHLYPKTSGKILKLPPKEELAIIHKGYDSISEFIDRQNRYSSIEAENLYAEGARFSFFEFLWKPTREFLVRFIKHMGFLDGFYGFFLTFLMVMYKIQVMIKIWEIQKQKK